MKVPEWKGYFPQLQNVTILESEIENIIPIYIDTGNRASDNQEAFYIHWLCEWKKGKALDVEGNIAYIFCYMYANIDHFIKHGNSELFKNNLDKVYLHYGHYKKIREYYYHWMEGFYIFTGDIEKALECSLKKMEIYDYRFSTYNFYSLKINIEISSELLFSLAGIKSFMERRLTPDAILKFTSFIEEYIKDFNQKNHKNIVDYYILKMGDMWNLNEESLKEYKYLFLNSIFEKKLKGYFQQTDYRKKIGKENYYTSAVFGCHNKLILDNKYYYERPSIPEFIETILQRQLKFKIIELFNNEFINDQSIYIDIKKKLKYKK